MKKLVGHHAQRERLFRLIRKGSLPSSIMLSGPRGIGKRLVALEVALSLFCEHRDPQTFQGCMHCKACHLVENLLYPDLHYIDCEEKDSASAEAIRDLLYTLNLTSFSGSVRLVLIDNAENLSTHVANLLLKSLEEPRPDTYFILVTSNPSKLPATLVSRCQVWFFEQLSKKELLQVLTAEDSPLAGQALSESERSRIVELADGSLELIKEIGAEGELFAEIRERLQQLTGADDVAGLQFADELGKKKDALRFHLRLLRIVMRQLMHEAHVPQEKRRWALALSNLIEAEYLILDRNLNASYVLATIFLSIADPLSGKRLPSQEKLLATQVV